PRLLIQVPPTASTTGVWSTLPDGCPINPVHVALMHNGKLLLICGSGNYETNFVFTAGIFDPARNLVQTFPIATDLFCNGMAILPDGRPLVVGGTMTYDTAATGVFTGLPTTAIFDPSPRMFTPGAAPPRLSSTPRPPCSRPDRPWTTAAGIRPSRFFPTAGP